MSPQSDKSTLFLIPADIKKLHRFILNQNPEYSGSWLYFGKNILLRCSIEEILGNQWKRIPIGEKLQETASELRQEYINYIGILGSQNAGPCWWLTSLSEKSPFISDFFLYCCYLRICIQCVGTRSGNLIIICESPALLRALSVNLKGTRNTVFCNRNECISGSIKKTRMRFDTIFQRGWFASRYCIRIFLSRFFAFIRKKQRKKDQKRQVIVIHSWTDKRSFQNPTHYQNVYFGNLSENLEKLGFATVHLVNILPTMNYLAALWALLKRTGNTVLIEEFISFSDILKSLRAIKTLPINLSEIPDFLELDVRDLIVSELQKDRMDTRAEQSYLYYCASRRMGEQLHISTFTYAFENQILEKMFCLGLERSSPGTKKIAYTSTFAIPMYTFYSISKHEKGIIPLPDRIVVNNSRSREVLLDSGFSETEILIASDIRYATKTDKKTENITRPSMENAVILVPLSAAILDSIELIHKIISVFKDDRGLQVIFKSHPVLPFKSLQEHLPVFPPHITFQDKTIGELLDIADLIIYTETTVSIEALARGIPVLHVTSDQRIDMNPLEGFHCIPSVSKLDKLRSTAFMLMQTRTEQQKMYKKIAAGFFNEIQPDLTEIFFGKNQTMD